MKTTQVIAGADFVKILKHCDLREKIALYSTKEIVKDYVLKLNNETFEIDKFKAYFDDKVKSLLSLDITVDTSCHVAHKGRYVLMFYFLDNEVKKFIQVCVN